MAVLVTLQRPRKIRQNHFFAHSVFINQVLHLFKVASSIFHEENQLCRSFQRELLQDDTLLRGKKVKIAQHPAGFQPTTSQLGGVYSTTLHLPRLGLSLLQRY